MRNEVVAICPCYNVAPYCENVIQEILPRVSHLIAVDDGSTDETEQILQRIAGRHPQKLTLIVFPKNRGKGFALLEGFQYAIKHWTFTALATIDADGQHQANDIERLAQAIDQGAEMAVGSRNFHQMPLKNSLGNRIASYLLRRIYPKAPKDTQSGLRAFSHRFAEEITQKIPGGRYEMEYRCLFLALKQNRKITELPIHTIYIDQNASSHFRAWKDSWLIIRSLFQHLFTRCL